MYGMEEARGSIPLSSTISLGVIRDIGKAIRLSL